MTFFVLGFSTYGCKDGKLSLYFFFVEVERKFVDPFLSFSIHASCFAKYKTVGGCRKLF